MLVLRNLFLYFGSYTRVTKLILVFRILYLYYGTYYCLLDLILVLLNLFLSFGSYTCSNTFLESFSSFSFFVFQFVISHMAIEVDIHDRFSC